MLEDFIIVDMPETDDAQIILGRPILAIAGCQIYVRVGHISFEVKGRFAMFSHRKENAISPYSSILDALPLFLECDMEYVLLKILLILNGFHLRILTMGMLKWNFLLLCHLANSRLGPLSLMILR